MYTGCGERICRKKNDGGAVESSGRYFAYVEDQALWILDVKEQKTQKLNTDKPITEVANIMCGDKTNKMIIQADGALYYWNGTSDKAEYIDAATGLYRVSENMERVFYRKDDAVYCYTPPKGSEKILDDVPRVSVSKDGSHCVAVCYELDQKKEVVLYERTAGGKLNRISDVQFYSVNMAADHFAICYLKSTGVDEQGTQQQKQATAYLWTPKGGEKKLPFEAKTFYVFSEDEIYYIQQNGSKQQLYYYNGKSSELLMDDCYSHAHKLGEQALYCGGRNPDLSEDYLTFWVIRNGKKQEIPGYFCTTKGNLAGLAPDGKILYCWGRTEKDTMYAISLEDKNLGEVIASLDTGDSFSPRRMDVARGNVLYLKDAALWLNDQKIAEGEEVSGKISDDGQMVTYLQNGDLYRYALGTSTLLESEKTVEAHYPACDGKVVYLVQDGAYISENNQKTEMKIHPTELIPVRIWSEETGDIGSIMLSGIRKGAWYNPDTLDQLVNWS